MRTEIITSIIGGSCGAALVTGAVTLIQFFIRRKDKASGHEDAQNKALRYLMLYIIQERCMTYIRSGEISLDERRAMHHWHDVYHNGLGGNGDANSLMEQIDHLPISDLSGCHKVI